MEVTVAEMVVASMVELLEVAEVGAPLEVAVVLSLAIRAEDSSLVQIRPLLPASLLVGASFEKLVLLLLLAELEMDHHPERGQCSEKSSGSSELHCSTVRLARRPLDQGTLQGA